MSEFFSLRINRKVHVITPSGLLNNVIPAWLCWSLLVFFFFFQTEMLDPRLCSDFWAWRLYFHGYATYASFWRLHMDRYGRQPRRSHTKRPLQFLQRKWNSNRQFLCPINFTAFAISMDPFPRSFKKKKRVLLESWFWSSKASAESSEENYWVCDCSKSDKELAVKCVICNNSWITRTIRICHRLVLVVRQIHDLTHLHNSWQTVDLEYLNAQVARTR